MSELKYEFVPRRTREELAVMLESKSAPVVANALYAATRYEEDWPWVQDQCLKALASSEVTVRWAAATCLGDLAFLRRPLDVGRVIPALEQACGDPEVADPASFSLGNVMEFLVGE